MSASAGIGKRNLDFQMAGASAENPVLRGDYTRAVESSRTAIK